MTSEPDIARVSILFFLWVLYFCVHSWTASAEFKETVYRRWPRSRSSFRLIYNVFSTLTLLPLVMLMYVWRGDLIIQWTGVYEWLANLIALTALIMFYHSTRFYDMQRFLGVTELRAEKKGASPESFCLSPYHRFVRHPWYSFGLLIIWTRSMDIMQLISTIAVTCYLILGSRLEERKLVHEFGEVYSRYKTKVPGLVPLPWKYLKREEKL